jgi:Flp pilus assembly protein TadD
VRAFHAIMLASAGRHDEAVAEARTARQLDPLSPLVNMSVGWTLFFAGRCEEALAELTHTRELMLGDAREEPGSVIIVALELLGRFDEAARVAATTACFGVPLDGERLLAAFRSGGAEGYWRERLDALDRAASTARPLIHYSYAAVLAQLGRRDEAVQHLETLVDLHHGGPVFFAVDPALAPLAGHAGFERMLTRIGMPRSPTASAPHTAST